jgi:hypothetical protein
LEEKLKNNDFYFACYRCTLYKSDSRVENNKFNREISNQTCCWNCCWNLRCSLLWFICLHGMLGFDRFWSKWVLTKVHFNAVLQSWFFQIHYFQKNHLVEKWRWNCFDSQDLESRGRIKRAFLKKTSRNSWDFKFIRHLTKPITKWK